MPPKVKHTAHTINQDQWWKGALIIRFYKDMCYDKSEASYPYDFSAEQVTEFDLDDPHFNGLFAPIFMGLVNQLIKNGKTGVAHVIALSPRIVVVFYDVDEVESIMKLREYVTNLVDLIHQVVDCVDTYGWPTEDVYATA